ncbi:hypothetical protein J3R83DRAFT_6368, partial [Lanmaoa asiatica]
SGMRLNGCAVVGRLDDAVLRCIVSPRAASIGAPGSVQNSAVIQAVFCGTSFTADVPIDVAEIDCDVIVGREWMALFHHVVDGRPVTVRGSDGVLPSSSEEYYMPVLPIHGRDSTELRPCLDDASSSLSSRVAQRQHSERMLEAALHSADAGVSALSIFHSDVDVLCRCCELHGVEVPDGGEYCDLLLKHFFTGMCAFQCDDGGPVACREVSQGFESRADIVSFLVGSVLRPAARYTTDRLSMVARGVGLVTSGAGIERRKLVSMLEDFKSSCTSISHNVAAESLFGSFEYLDRGSLLSLGFAHGLVLSGGRDGMRDALALHLARGECLTHCRKNIPVCSSVVQEYMLDSVASSCEALQVRILEAVCPCIKALPLKRLLRLLDVSFDPTLRLARLRKSLSMYVDLLRRRRERQSVNVSCSRWPSLVPDQRKSDVLRGFRHATSSATLKTFVCASCDARRCSGELVRAALGDIDLGLLNRPDVRVADGKTVHAQWID